MARPRASPAIPRVVCAGIGRRARNAAESRGRRSRFRLGASQPRALPGAGSASDVRRGAAGQSRDRARRAPQSKFRVSVRMRKPGASPDVAAHERTARRRASAERAFDVGEGGGDPAREWDGGRRSRDHAPADSHEKPCRVARCRGARPTPQCARGPAVAVPVCLVPAAGAPRIPPAGQKTDDFTESRVLSGGLMRPCAAVYFPLSWLRSNVVT